MHQTYPWNPKTLERLCEIEDLSPHSILPWIRAMRSGGLSDGAIHRLLALASARSIDHHGPFIGHGTFNGGPVLRASSILSPHFKDLALLQTAVYVVELFEHPNYGPYRLMAMKPVMEETLDQSKRAWIEDVESGQRPLQSEHRVVGLFKAMGSQIRWLLTEAALRQYPENEHRLLMVHRACQLLDDTDGWSEAEPLLRAAVQYLASRPNTQFISEKLSLLPHWPEAGKADATLVARAIEQLTEVEYGQEVDVLLDLIASGASGATLHEAIALTSSDWLRRTRFDAHAVTGVHCALDLLSDKETPATLRALAGTLALSSSRARRQKENRDAWRTPLPVEGQPLHLNEVRTIVLSDHEGLQAAQAAGNFVRSGGDAVSLARSLMEIALTTSGPFDAIHNVKMLWGLLLETQRSTLPQQAWVHLAAGARVVAETAAAEKEKAAPILAQWKESLDWNTPGI